MGQISVEIRPLPGSVPRGNQHPQAWAAAAPLGALAAALGLAIDGCAGVVRLDRPRMPRRLEEVRLSNLQTGGGSVDLRCRRTSDGGVAVDVLARRGEIDVVVKL